MNICLTHVLQVALLIAGLLSAACASNPERFQYSLGHKNLEGSLEDFHACATPKDFRIDIAAKKLETRMQGHEWTLPFQPPFYEKLQTYYAGFTQTIDYDRGRSEILLRLDPVDLEELADALREEISRLSTPTGLTELYLKAYFGDPLARHASAFIELDTSDPASWAQKIGAGLKLQDQPELLRQIWIRLLPQLQAVAANPGGKYYLPVTMDEAGFVSHFGKRYRFPGTADAEANQPVDQSQVGADVVRVVLEANRDSLEELWEEKYRLPAIATATGVKIRVLRPFDPQHDRAWNIAAPDDWLALEAKASQVETWVAGAVGKAIRGGSAFSANNEALAKAVETAAGVIARHAAERALWCATRAERGQAKGEEL